MVGDTFHSHQLKLQRGVERLDRCPDRFRSCLDKTEGQRDDDERHLDQQRAGQGRAPASDDIYDRYLDNNDRCPDKQRVVGLKTRTVRGKPPAATAAAHKYRDNTAGHAHDAEAFRPVSDKGAAMSRT
jgi:hypothetical protein